MTKTSVRSLRVESLGANQNVIIADGNELLQSYDSQIAIKYADGKVELGTDWEYSRTTMKFVGQFLGSNATEIRQKIKSGEWKLNKSL